MHGAKPATAKSSAPSDGRNNTNRVAVFGRGVLFRQIANVFVVDVDVYEAAQLAVFGKKMFAQIGELRRQVAEGFPDSGRVELRGITLSGVHAKRRGNHDLHCHGGSPQEIKTWPVKLRRAGQS